MRFRKTSIILTAAAVLLAAIFIYFDARLLDRIKQTSQTQEGTQPDIQTGNEDTDGNSQEDAADGADGETADGELVASEDVSVEYNSPEYDIELKLCENSDGKTFLRLRYYMDGISSVHDLYEEQIPELADIFEDRKTTAQRGGETGNADTAADAVRGQDMKPASAPYTIGRALLNPVHGQMYILINGAPLDEYTQSSFYVISLYDISIKKLFSYPAIYGKMSFSSDYALLAYDFEDPPLMSTYQEDSLFEVISCAGEEYLVRGSRRQDQSLIGPDSDPGYIYDYIFNGWKDTGTAKLIRVSRPKGDAGAGPTASEVLYDVIANKMYNTDGSEITTAGAGQENDQDDGRDTAGGAAGNGEENAAGAGDRDNAESGGENTAGGKTGQKDGGGPGKAEESEPVKQLRSFYSYLGSVETYDKAMKLLDDDFVLRLAMFKQFGIEEIRKSDIDAGYNQDNVAMYSQLLMAAKFERVTDVGISDDGTAVVRYYHTLELSADSRVSQMMSARLVKKNKVWTIKSIEEGIK
jgi:hypothetical protein